MRRCFAVWIAGVNRLIDPGIYARNKEALPPYLRELADKEERRPASEATVDIAGSLPDRPVALVRTGAGKAHTNSAADPYGEAEQWAESIAYKDVRISFIYGCGFGYPLLSYGKRKKPYTETFVFERSPELFCAMLRCVDVRPLLLDPQVHFIVGDLQQMKRQWSVFLTGDFLYRCASMSATFTHLAHRNEKRVYLELHETLWNLIGLLTASLGNTVHDTLAGLYNTLDNTGAVLAAPDLSALRGAYEGKPAIIIANGPSLDRNIDLLREAAGRALLLATPSSFSACRSRGIVPDAVCLTERSPGVYRLLFDGERIGPETLLVGLTVIDPRIPGSFAAPWLPVFRNGELSAKWVRDTVAADHVGMHGGLSSTHLAFELALLLGADPVIFVGQDLAFGRDRTTHSQHSVYAEERMAELVRRLQAEPALLVRGVGGAPVATTKLWLDFKTWFEHQISRYAGKRVFINATEGGARIEGTREMSLRAALDGYCGEPLARPLAVHVAGIPLGQRLSAVEAGEALARQTDSLIAELHALVQAAEADIGGLRMLELACRIRSEHPDTDMPLFAQPLVEKLEKAYEKFTDNERLVTFIQHIVFAFQRQIVELGEIDSIGKLSEWVRLQRHMILHLKRTCGLLIIELGEAKNRLRRRSSAHFQA